MADEKFYTSLELAPAAGISYRQVDHWTRYGILKPEPGVTGMGTRRLFPESEVIIARILGRIRNAIEGDDGSERSRFRDLAEELRDTHSEGKHAWAPGIELDLTVLAKPNGNGDESATPAALPDYPYDTLDIAGVDLSLTATGVATRRGTLTIGSNARQRGPERLIFLRDSVLHHVRRPALVVLEGYSYASTNQGPQMGELGGIIRVALHEAGIPYVVVPPTVVKKYTTGKGNATKGQVLVAAVSRAGEGFDGDDNQADAFWLRQMGAAHYNDFHIPMPQQNREALTKIEWPEL